MKDKYRISISSPPDREKLVVEIFFGETQWAEINQEHDSLQVEFYPRPDGQPWRIDFHDAFKALDEGKRRLL
jgi:hypothetical protein